MKESVARDFVCRDGGCLASVVGSAYAGHRARAPAVQSLSSVFRQLCRRRPSCGKVPQYTNREQCP